MVRFVRSLVLLALVAFACSPDEDPKDSSTAAASTTDGSTGASTDPTDGGAGGHGDCDQFLACLTAVEPGAWKAYNDALGPAGACWDEIPETVQKCLDTCSDELDKRHEAFPAEPACPAATG